MACSFGTSISFISNSGSLNLFYGACNFADDSFQTSSAFLNYFVFNCTDGTTTYSTNTSSAAGLAFQTSPTDSDTATTALGSLVLGTALQNLTGYDVMLIVYINITVNVSGTISSGVGPTVTPTQQTIVTGVTTLGIVPVTVYLPANYYALISVDVNITATIVGQQATPI